MIRILTIVLLLSIVSCKKDKDDNSKYINDFIGVYTAQIVNSSGSPFVLLIDKQGTDTILIQTRWIAGEDRVFKAGITKHNFKIPKQTYNSQAYNSQIVISGNGELINGNTIVINYFILGGGQQTHKIIASK